MLEMQKIKISDYNYSLTEDWIAKFPLQQRDASNLLVYQNNEIKDFLFKDLDQILPSNSRLIFNNTKVIRARLHFKKSTGADIEIFCLEPHNPSEYVLAFESKSYCEWTCLIGNAKKWKEGHLESLLSIQDKTIKLRVNKIPSDGLHPIVAFSWDSEDLSFSEIIEHIGELPIPPYLQRKTEASDLVRYQTVYSKIQGSVAAPTAGLHFTEDVFRRLREKSIELSEITLHVGAGTFKPVQSEIIGDHAMHTEHFIVEKSTLKDLLDHCFTVPVGTTSVRTLESLYWLAVKIKNGTTHGNYHVQQWDPYELDADINAYEAIEILLNELEKTQKLFLEASTEIMIVPSYSFKFADAIITNFHQPKSTLLLLVSAFVGDAWKSIYSHALNQNYRFLSYGDSSLLFPSI
ncbi:MAG: S-adenosylmethionine:tRNA ribosyltransferase-isomerase [Bacteroidales bacterium]|nr:S-adenosylmethionine:tRNA ribosyltransferase-isomerase [Bacteroidales bacterium]